MRGKDNKKNTIYIVHFITNYISVYYKENAKKTQNIGTFCDYESIYNRK